MLEIKKYLDAGNYAEAKKGMDILVEYEIIWEKRNIKDLLVQLMFELLEVKVFPQKRTVKWWIRVRDLREKIEIQREDNPYLDEAFVRSIWQEAYDWAKELAETGLRLDQKKHLAPFLEWDEVFTKGYKFRYPSKKINAQTSKLIKNDVAK